jgi:hypothetical protein
MSSNNPNRALLSVRAAVILMLSVLTGIGVVMLLLLEGASPTAAILSGVGTLAAAMKFFHWLIA